MAGDQEHEVEQVETSPDGEEPEEVEEPGDVEEAAGDEVPEEDGGGDDEGGEAEDEDEDEEEEEEEDLIDPMDAMKENCGNTSECRKLKEKFEQCEERVSSRQRTEETCAEELLDFLHCQDHCVSKSLFSKLK